MNRMQNAIIGLVAVAAFAVGIGYYQQQSSKTYSEQIYVYEPTRIINPFKLTDQSGDEFNNQNLQRICSDCIESAFTIYKEFTLHCPISGEQYL